MDNPVDCSTADGLLVAIRALKLNSPDLTAKEIHAELAAAGQDVELSAVKKAAGKVVKAIAQEATLLPPPPPPPPPAAAHSARKEKTSARKEKADQRGMVSARKEQAAAALAPTTDGRPLPLLVSPRAGAIAFLRCHACQAPVEHAMVCGGCHAVCYCSPSCQAADYGAHADECASLCAHMSSRYRVRWPTERDEPPWLPKAMDHRCEMSWCELLRSIGCHDMEGYQLLCGCCMPSANHRYVATDGLPPPTEESSYVDESSDASDASGGGTHASSVTTPATTGQPATIVHSWAEYYATRRLPLDSPLALLLTWPLTVYYALARLGLANLPAEREVAVHYLGPEKEIMFLPLFREIACLCPASTICITMVGPLGIALPPPIEFRGAKGGKVVVTVLKGLYHELHLPPPDLAIAPNAGLAVSGYKERWPPTLRHLERKGIPFLFSDYSEQSIEKGLALARVVSETLARVQGKEGLPAALGGPSGPSTEVVLNPFRAPMRLPRVDGGSVGHPTVSNGWFACFRTPPGAFDEPPPAADRDEPTPLY